MDTFRWENIYLDGCTFVYLILFRINIYKDCNFYFYMLTNYNVQLYNCP